MTDKQRVKGLIVQLKQIKEERDLSSQDIFNMVTASGGYISLSSIKRVFAEGSEEKGFRYFDTIQPIARALIGINEESAPLDAAEADALKNIALFKDNVIKELQIENETLSLRVEQLEQAVADYEQRISFFKEQINRKDDYIDRLAKKVGI